MKFSQRMGITPSIKEIQINSIDIDLKNGLWNIYELLLKAFNPSEDYLSSYGIHINDSEKAFSYFLWHNFFKWTVDSLPNDRADLRVILKDWFYKAQWHQIYDLIECSFSFISDKRYQIDTFLIEIGFNKVLEREFSGYRFINGVLAPITNEHEIDQVKESIEETGAFTAFKVLIFIF